MERERGSARAPDRTGIVERDGVQLSYAVYGGGETTVLLMPTWSILHSRFWKAQVPYLSRRHRVLTFDGRGSGRSSRPTGAAAYANTEFAADALAVMDATGTDQAVLVALSCGVPWAVQVAAAQPRPGSRPVRDRFLLRLRDRASAPYAVPLGTAARQRDRMGHLQPAHLVAR